MLAQAAYRGDTGKQVLKALDSTAKTLAPYRYASDIVENLDD